MQRVILNVYRLYYEQIRVEIILFIYAFISFFDKDENSWWA